ncbi:hypothetical protein ACFE04_017289 [Oxalis oulophora]
MQIPLTLQTAHVPFVEESVIVADKALVTQLERLSNFKQFYRDFSKNPNFVDSGFNLGSSLEAQVQENQSKLRVLGTVSNRLQAEIDQKHREVVALRKQLGEIHKSNANFSKKLSASNSNCDVLCSVKVFDSVLRDTCREMHKFSKILIDLMNKAGWDLDLAAKSVYNNVQYAKKGHNRYAFLSYVCLGMFRGFDSVEFGIHGSDVLSNVHGQDSCMSTSSLKQLLEHISSNPMELLSRDQNCSFSKFCEKKYQELVHPSMESSIFTNLDQKEAVLKSWRSLSIFYESFVNMAGSIWTLHKLAFSFEPVVEIFQVERGADFSVIFMEDVTRKCSTPGKCREKVDFTVVPGFRINTTVIQSQVYLTGLKCTE